MMTQQLGFSVLTAPLAAIDRRSLSEAWYSALHLAHDASSARREAAPRVPAQGSARAIRSGAAVSAHRPARDAAIDRRAPTAPARGRGSDAPPLERRAPRTLLGKKIERAFTRPCRTIERASFAVDARGARVHVTLQHEGERLRLVAICPPSARERVARALDEARYALAARGIACTLSVRENGR